MLNIHQFIYVIREVSRENHTSYQRGLGCGRVKLLVKTYIVILYGLAFGFLRHNNIIASHESFIPCGIDRVSKTLVLRWG